MIRNFELLFDLLELPLSDDMRVVGKYILDHSASNYTFCHPQSFVLDAWLDFVRGKISQEDFLALGDISSHRVLKFNGGNCRLFFESLSYAVDHDPASCSSMVYIFPQLAFEKVFVKETVSKLIALGSRVLFC